DLLARFGQLPFAALGAVTLYALAQRLGAKPVHALYSSVFFLLSRPILEQAIGANVDLICAVLFLASLYFGIVAADRQGPRGWLFFGVAVGLYTGTKSLALVYLPILFIVAVARGLRRSMLWAIPGLAFFALPWYLRNWTTAGSPIYPASLAIAGITV